MKLANTAPITGATIYRIKFPSPLTIFGPNVRAGFILAPVKPPNKKASKTTIELTHKASTNKLAFLLTRTRIEYIKSNVIAISIPQEYPVET